MEFSQSWRWGLLCVVGGVACAEDPEIVRRGNDLPTPVEEQPSNAGAGGQGAAGATSSAPISWCDARQVLVAKCQRCHQDPPQNGAPMPLLTYEDTQGMWTMTKDVHDVMLDVIARNFMPYVALNDPPTSLMPPVEALSDGEKLTLLTWLMEGALPEGGTDCPD